MRATCLVPSSQQQVRSSSRRIPLALSATIGDFLTAVEAWIPVESERIYAIKDNLNVHAAYDVLLFRLAHPRWEFIFQPTYAA